MAGKIGKIILDIILSFMFFIVAAIILDSIAGVIFGNKSNGGANVNGYVMLVITSVLTIVFAVLFYKYVRLGKKSKTEQ
jgi:membrane protein implicated in regulation of membrane protease activity